MNTIIAIIGALAVASIPIMIGWRRTSGEAGMARALGLAVPKSGFDPEKFALQTGTGFTFNQMLIGAIAWAGGGFAAGLFLGSLVTAILFATGGGLLYLGGLSQRRQEFRLRQAKDILRGLGLIETLLEQGRALNDSIEEAAKSIGPDGEMVFSDLVVRLRTARPEEAAKTVREWTMMWDNPAVDVVGTALLASFESRIAVGPLVSTLRTTMSDVVEVLSRARAAAKGVEWQARFLALFPPGVMVLYSTLDPNFGRAYASNPLLALPVLLGSGVSYALSMNMIRKGLSIESSVGLQGRRGGVREGEIRLDRMGRIE